jgi:cytochrome P450
LCQFTAVDYVIRKRCVGYYSHDPEAFPDPEAVRLDRPLGSHMRHGFSPHGCLGMGISVVVLTEIVKAIVRLPGLRRVWDEDGMRGEY